ncbi:MAG: hypothetical protein ACOC7U_06125 [Spirochaetota bacterium]
MKIIIYGILLGILGLITGYVIYGRIGGEYLEFDQVFNPPENILEDFAESITGVEKARQRILLSGAIGTAVGLIIGAIRTRKR